MNICRSRVTVRLYQRFMFLDRCTVDHGQARELYDCCGGGNFATTCYEPPCRGPE